MHRGVSASNPVARGAGGDHHTSGPWQNAVAEQLRFSDTFGFEEGMLPNRRVFMRQGAILAIST